MNSDMYMCIGYIHMYINFHLNFDGAISKVTCQTFEGGGERLVTYISITKISFKKTFSIIWFSITQYMYRENFK